MARELSDWLDSYLLFTENTEPPKSYHTWCGLSMLAGALQRKVYLQWGFERIFPNLFVVLVGPSGKTRKGLAIGTAKAMLAGVSTVSIAPEAASREALILAMKRSIANFQDSTDDKIKFHCSITAFSEELAVLLGQGDIKFLANLTDWYDSKDEWAYETVGRGKDSLQGLCVNLMGATAPEWLQSMLPQEAVGGGFTSRVIFIVEERKGKTVAKHQKTPEEEELEATLIRDLERISQLSGQYNFAPIGEKLYIDWYEEQDRLLGQGEAAVPDPRFAGYCERRATHLRKLMMLCSASRGDSLELDQHDFRKALGVMKSAERNMHKTFGGLGKARHSDSTELIMRYIEKVGITMRSVILQKFYRDIDPVVMKEIEETMQNMKVVKITYHPQKGDKVYEWIGSKDKEQP